MYFFACSLRAGRKCSRSRDAKGPYTRSPLTTDSAGAFTHVENVGRNYQRQARRRKCTSSHAPARRSVPEKPQAGRTTQELKKARPAQVNFPNTKTTDQGAEKHQRTSRLKLIQRSSRGDPSALFVVQQRRAPERRIGTALWTSPAWLRKPVRDLIKSRYARSPSRWTCDSGREQRHDTKQAATALLRGDLLQAIGGALVEVLLNWLLCLHLETASDSDTSEQKYGSLCRPKRGVEAQDACVVLSRVCRQRNDSSERDAEASVERKRSLGNEKTVEGLLLEPASEAMRVRA